MITVFYDGKCGLCAKEIAYYQKIAPAGRFNWQDITQDDDMLRAQDISLADGLKKLHVRDPAGQLHIGVDGFILMWRHIKIWSILAFLVRLPIIYHLAKIAYHYFAEWRFKRLSHCQIAEADHAARR